MTDLSLPLQFLRPWFLLSIFPIGYILYKLWHFKASSIHTWQKHIDKNLLKHILINPSSEKKKNLWFYSAVIASFLTIFSLSGPSWEKSPAPVFSQKDALIIVLDLSLSMYAEDGSPSRIKQATFKIKDILRQRKQGLTGLIVFSGEAYSVTPLSDDPSTIEALLPSLTPAIMPNYGSDIVSALSKAQELIQQANINSANILFLVDDVESSQIRDAEDILNNKNKIAVIGIGSEKGAPILLPDNTYLKNRQHEIVHAEVDQARLQKFASALNGKYHSITLNDDDINAVLTSADKNTQQHKSEKDYDLWKDGSYYFILLLIPFALLLFRQGYLLALLALFILPTPPSHAFEWDALFKNEKQRAMESYNTGKDNSDIDYFDKQTKKQQSTQKEAEAHYNLANSLAKKEKFEDAIKQYDEALKKQANFEDAKFNKDIVKKLLQKKKEEEKKEQDQKKDNKEQNKDGDEKKQENSKEDKDGDQQQKSDEKSDQQSESNDPKQQDSQDQKEQDDKQSSDDPSQQQKKDDKESDEKKDQQASQQEKQVEEDQKEAQSAQEESQQVDDKDREQQRATQQWLDQIEENPGGLLKNKFKYQFQQQQSQGQSNIKNDQEKFW